MICNYCAMGADVVDAASGKHIPYEDEVAIAVDLHTRCKGGTWCDCHHRIKPRKNVAVAA